SLVSAREPFNSLRRGIFRAHAKTPRREVYRDQAAMQQFLVSPDFSPGGPRGADYVGKLNTLASPSQSSL
ncbi:MAG: hypothetical protein QNJ82_15390, partial [Gammaproteobacteria bacterium]|nr:hypothetical protein [Gammaproteobacteria bacterium]